MRPRCIQLTRRVKPLKALCTDASWEPHSIGCAWPWHCFTRGSLGRHKLLRLRPWRLQAFAHLASELAGHDVLVFIDNTSACRAVVKEGSAAGDIFFLACTAHLLWNFLQCRVYVEYIPFEANLSDGLSRDGAMDQWTPSPCSLPHVPLGIISVLMVWQMHGGTCCDGEMPRLLPWVFDLLRVGYSGLCPGSTVRGPSMMLDDKFEMEERACIVHDMCRHGRMF